MGLQTQHFYVTSDPAKPNEASFVAFVYTQTSITLRGSQSPHISAESGPLDSYKVISINGAGRSSQLVATYDSDLEISGLESGTVYDVQVANVVSSVAVCGIMESSVFATLNMCTSKIFC